LLGGAATVADALVSNIPESGGTGGAPTFPPEDFPPSVPGLPGIPEGGLPEGGLPEGGLPEGAPDISTLPVGPDDLTGLQDQLAPISTAVQDGAAGLQDIPGMLGA
jgi:hypothetical protein